MMRLRTERRRLGWLAVAAGLAVLQELPSAAQTMSLGPQFRVDEKGPGSRRLPQVVRTGEGEFVATWYGSALGPRGRRLGFQGAQFESFPMPFVPTDLAGGLASFWATTQDYIAPGDWDILLQRFDHDGRALSLLFDVNTTAAPSVQPRISMGHDESFMVVWFDEVCGPLVDPMVGRHPCAALGSHGRGFSPAGEPAGDPFEVSTGEGRTRVLAGATGEFVVAASEDGFQSDTAYAQVVDLGGEPSGLVVPIGHLGQTVRLSDDDFVVVWATAYEDPAQIRVARFAPDGAPRGPADAIESCSTCILESPEVGAGAHGDFLVVWGHRVIGGPDRELVGRWVGHDGRVSELAVLNASGTPEQDDTIAHIASASSGDFLLAWASESAESEESIQARTVRSPLIFADGFESGSTAAWSQVVSWRVEVVP